MVEKLHERALLVAITTFVLGIALASIFYNWRIDSTQLDTSSLDADFEQSRAAWLFFQAFHQQEDFCTAFSPLLQQMAQKTGELGNQVDQLEKSQGYNDPQVEAIKQSYTIQNIVVWLYIANLRNECSEPIHTVLYFYTNRVGECVSCRAQAIVLDDVRKKNANVWVFAIERNSNLSLVEAVAKRFNVQTLPTLVVDENVVLSGFQEESAIEQALR